MASVSRVTFLAFFLLASVSFVSAIEWCDEGTNQQRLFNSLNGLYLNTETDTWTYDHLWGTPECPCSWFGVDCGGNNTASSITLNLDDNGIVGTVDEDFCDDIYSFINLSNNDFFGVLAECIGELQILHTLKLENNNFQGLLPAGIEEMEALSNLDIRNNSFSGPIPTFITCPEDFSADVKYSNNDFWCVEDCSEDECGECAEEPSSACTTKNTIACGEDLSCCYSESWNDVCDELVDKESETECQERAVCPDSSSSGLAVGEILLIIFVILLALAIVLAIGWVGTCYITFRKRQWSFQEVKPHLIQEEDDNSLMEALDEDLYYDGIPPRSSLDFEL